MNYTGLEITWSIQSFLLFDFLKLHTSCR